MYAICDDGQDKTNTMTNHINTRNESALLRYHRHYLGTRTVMTRFTPGIRGSEC